MRTESDNRNADSFKAYFAAAPCPKLGVAASCCWAPS